jgi:hypothetical protein
MVDLIPTTYAKKQLLLACISSFCGKDEKRIRRCLNWHHHPNEGVSPAGCRSDAGTSALARHSTLARRVLSVHLPMDEPMARQMQKLEDCLPLPSGLLLGRPGALCLIMLSLFSLVHHCCLCKGARFLSFPSLFFCQCQCGDNREFNAC